MICEKCGKEIPEDSTLCGECLQNKTNAEPLGNNSEANEIAENITETDEQKLPKRIKEKRKHRIVAHVFATFLSVILALLLIATTCLIVIRDAISPDTIKDMISNINLNEVKIEDVADKEVLESHGLVCESDNLLDIIYDNIDQEQLPVPISKEEFSAIVEDEQFREYFGEIFGVSIEALTSGNASDVVTPENIVDCLGDNRETFSSYLGYELTDERLDSLQTTLEEDYGQVFEVMGNQKLDVLVGDDVAGVINIVFADWLFWVMVLADLVIGALIFLVLRSVSSGVKFCATTIIFVGVIFLCVAIALLNGLISVLGDGPIMYIVNQFASVLLWETIVISIVMIVIGIIAPISVMLISRYKKRHVV